MYITELSEAFELESRLTMDEKVFDLWFGNVWYYIEVTPVTDYDKTVCLFYNDKYYIAVWYSTIFYTAACIGFRTRSIMDAEVEILKAAPRLWFTIKDGNMFITDSESNLCS